MPNLLNFLIWFPMVTAILMLMFVQSDKPLLAKIISLTCVLISLVISIGMLLQFNLTQTTMQFEFDQAWISIFNIRYHLGVDGVSLILIVLSIFTNIIVIFSTWNSIHNKITSYLASFNATRTSCRCIFLIRCHFILHILGSDPYSDVFNYRYLGFR